MTAIPVKVTDPMVDAPDGAKVTFPNGFVYERVAGTWEPIHTRCTGVTAAWCPVHGDCTCPDADDGTPTLCDDGCPLHDPLGPHGIWFDDPTDPLNTGHQNGS